VRRYNSAVLAVVICPSVCLSVCLSVRPSHASIVSKRLNAESRKQFACEHTELKHAVFPEL